MARLSDTELARIIQSNITASSWYDDQDARDNHERAIESYRQKKKPKKYDGLSEAQSNDVADMVEATISQVMPAFDFDTVARFKADGAADVEQSKVETAICNTELRDLNNGYTGLQESIRNALVIRNGILKCYTQRTIEVERRRYTDVNELALMQLMQPTAPDQRVELLNPKNQKQNTVDITVKRTTERRRLTIQSIDPLQFLLTREHTNISTQDAQFVGDRFFLTRSDLIERGHSKRKVFNLRTVDIDTESGESARGSGGETPEYRDHGDPAMKSVECFEVWLKVDADGDGIAERRRFLYAGGKDGGTILENEISPVSPYACGTPFLQPQRWRGMSLFDKLCDLEESKTDVLRQYHDNIAYANNSEVIIQDGLVNEEDLKARRPGGINRSDDVNALRELTISSNGAESIQLLNYWDKVRTERGGASLDLQAAQPATAGGANTAHGLERQYTSKEQLAQLITRTIAETMVRQLFLLIHATLRRDFPGERSAEAGNAFVTSDPAQWRPRFRLQIVAGMSYQERQERRLALEMTLGQQEKLIQAGFAGILVDLQTYHATLIDWQQASGVPNAARYWVDPRSPESLQQQEQKQAAEAANAEQQQQLQAALVTSETRTERTKQISDILQAKDQLAFDYWEATLKSAIEEMKLSQDQSNLVDFQQATGIARGAENE